MSYENPVRLKACALLGCVFPLQAWTGLLFGALDRDYQYRAGAGSAAWAGGIRSLRGYGRGSRRIGRSEEGTMKKFRGSLRSTT